MSIPIEAVVATRGFINLTSNAYEAWAGTINRNLENARQAGWEEKTRILHQTLMDQVKINDDLFEALRKAESREETNATDNFIGRACLRAALTLTRILETMLKNGQDASILDAVVTSHMTYDLQYHTVRSYIRSSAILAFGLVSGNMLPLYENGIRVDRPMLRQDMYFLSSSEGSMFNLNLNIAWHDLEIWERKPVEIQGGLSLPTAA